MAAGQARKLQRRGEKKQRELSGPWRESIPFARRSTQCSSVREVDCFELFRVIQLLPKSLNHQTNQGIRRGIREKGPIQPEGKVEMDTRKHNRAGKFHESHNRVGRGHRWRCDCEGIKCPASCYDKAHTRPHSDSVLHAATFSVLMPWSHQFLPISNNRRIPLPRQASVAFGGRGRNCRRKILNSHCPATR